MTDQHDAAARELLRNTQTPSAECDGDSFADHMRQDEQMVLVAALAKLKERLDAVA